ncbi:MAG: hypothetical protein BRD39_04810 [Bacteroidetes bacterium QH_9_64_21]|nr:MAG: hypothetical protein BRD39_04810 [Bacteroidetes bacterium QH_9_64_21]
MRRAVEQETTCQIRHIVFDNYVVGAENYKRNASAPAKLEAGGSSYDARGRYRPYERPTNLNGSPA